MAKLSDIGERAAIVLRARVFDRGQPIGLGHDCGVVDWGEDYLVGFESDCVDLPFLQGLVASMPHVNLDVVWGQTIAPRILRAPISDA